VLDLKYVGSYLNLVVMFVYENMGLDTDIFINMDMRLVL